jgi:hypothetical protein
MSFSHSRDHPETQHAVASAHPWHQERQADRATTAGAAQNRADPCGASEGDGHYQDRAVVRDGCICSAAHQGGDGIDLCRSVLHQDQGASIKELVRAISEEAPATPLCPTCRRSSRGANDGWVIDGDFDMLRGGPEGKCSRRTGQIWNGNGGARTRFRAKTQSQSSPCAPPSGHSILLRLASPTVDHAGLQRHRYSDPRSRCFAAALMAGGVLAQLLEEWF